MAKNTAPGKQYMVISVFAEDKPGILYEVSEQFAQYQCTIEKSRMAVFGSEVIMSILLTANWDALAKLETQLPSIEKKFNLTISTKRTSYRGWPEKEILPYTVELIAVQDANIIKEISAFFASQSLNLYELRSNTYKSHTGAEMFSLMMRVYIPAHYRISEIRENFLVLCEDMNIDAILEPERS